jgi:hypothetical protein
MPGNELSNRHCALFFRERCLLSEPLIATVVGALIQKAVEGQIKANNEGQSFGVRPTWS